MPSAKLLLLLAVLLGALLLLRKLLLLFRGGESVEDLKALKAAGARIVDVRSAEEFAGGHAPGSLNIPLDQFQARMGEIDPAVPVILCCASGGRSGMAKQLLERSGRQDVHNGGAYTNLL